MKKKKHSNKNLSTKLAVLHTYGAESVGEKTGGLGGFTCCVPRCYDNSKKTRTCHFMLSQVEIVMKRSSFERNRFILSAERTSSLH